MRVNTQADVRPTEERGDGTDSASAALSVPCRSYTIIALVAALFTRHQRLQVHSQCGCISVPPMHAWGEPWLGEVLYLAAGNSVAIGVRLQDVRH